LSSSAEGSRSENEISKVIYLKKEKVSKISNQKSLKNHEPTNEFKYIRGHPNKEVSKKPNEPIGFKKMRGKYEARTQPAAKACSREVNFPPTGWWSALWPHGIRKRWNPVFKRDKMAPWLMPDEIMNKRGFRSSSLYFTKRKFNCKKK
jgi:hypothetical protein